MEKDLYQHPDYYLVDELLTDEHKLIRDTVRAYVKRDISPIIEEYAQKAEFPKQIIKGLGEVDKSDERHTPKPKGGHNKSRRKATNDCRN